MGDVDDGVEWPRVWAHVATTVAGHLAAGRGHLVTRDTLRLATIMALQEVGVAASRMSLDLSGHPGGPAADLMLDGPGETVVDLGLPWDDEAGADTHAMGVLVRDLLRIGGVPATRRWVVQVLSPKRMAQLESAASRRGLPWPGREGAKALVERSTLDELPPGAARVLEGQRWRLPVVVACTGVWPVTVELALHVFEVSVPVAAEETEVLAPVAEPEPVPVREAVAAVQALERTPTAAPASPSPRGTARAEVLDAIRALVQRTGDAVVHVDEVLDEVRRAGSRFADAVVLTMMTRHMCAQVQGRGVASYDDLDQVDAHRYRLRLGR